MSRTSAVSANSSPNARPDPTIPATSPARGRFGAALALATLFVIASFAPVGFAQETTPTPSEDDRRGRGDADARKENARDRDDERDDDEDDGEGDEDDGRKDGEDGPRRAGKIRERNGTYEGRYVSFGFDADTCTLEDYRLYNVTFFERIQLHGECEADNKSGEHGHQVRIRSDDSEIKIHDAPNGLLRFEAEDGILFDWPDTMETAEAEKGGVELRADGNLTGLLRIDEDDEDDNLTIATGSAHADDASGSFWVHPMEGGSRERGEIRDAIKQRKVAGEIDVLLADGAVSTEVLPYENVTIRVSKKSDSSFRVLVDGNLTEGRVFVMNVGPGLFEKGKIGVRYYDADEVGLLAEVNITESDDLDDVLTIDAGEGPEYWIVHDQAGKHVLVAVPSFSVHVFEVQSLSATIVPSVAAGAFLGVAFVAALTVGVVPRRRNP